MYEFLLENAKKFSLLYVEDNAGLREKAERFFKKFFPDIHVAEDGEKGLLLYEKYLPDIVISDIKMPKMDGLEMSRRIRIINPESKIIITSAFDDKEYLMGAIGIGIFRYVNKPVSIEDMVEVLTQCIVDLQNKENTELFNRNIQDIFNYQDNLLVLLENEKPTIANYDFLKFFKITKPEEILKNKKTLFDHFSKHDNFLYGENVYKVLCENKNSLYNVKMKRNEKNYHFILKVKDIPDKENCIILSFSDVTELNLLENFSGDNKVDENKLLSLLTAIKNNKSKIKIHNFYKGLSITNEALICEVKKTYIQVQSNYVQQKAIQNEKYFILSSPLLPQDIRCEKISSINYDEQTTTSNLFTFLDSSPVSRKYVRVRPEEKSHNAEVIFKDDKYTGEVRDISIKAVRININSKVTKFNKGDIVKLNLELINNNQTILINCNSQIYRVENNKTFITIVLLLDISGKALQTLTEYISKRQLELIREFKRVDREIIND